MRKRLRNADRPDPTAASDRLGPTLAEVIESLPKEDQEDIEREFQRLNNEVETLRELRETAGKAQAHIAAALNIKQPSVSKIERQTDMYLSTLRGYVEAIGGELELTVRFPSRSPVRIRKLGEALDTAEPSRRLRKARSNRAKIKRRLAAVPA
jgi:transcriptional regulator with XRE-family HTH domain